MADLIDRDWVLARMQFGPDADVVRMAPAVEAVPVVRCKDCAASEPCSLWKFDGEWVKGQRWCNVHDFLVEDNGYCYKAEKMDGGMDDENA